jgi:hypothetical protein
VGELPNPNNLIGNVAHELANRVFAPGALKAEGEIRAEVERQFDEVVEAIAAPLQQPEFAGDLARARAQVPAALGKLAAMLQERSFRVVGTELDRNAEVDENLKLRGRLDLLVENDRGPSVVDLKWTRSSPKHRISEVKEGRAIQLVAYSAIANPGSATLAPGGFFLLSQRRMIAEKASGLSDEPLEASRTLGETWEALKEAWGTWRGLAQAGQAIATGLGEPLPAQAADLAIPPGEAPCKFCELTALCRVGALEA